MPSKRRVLYGLRRPPAKMAVWAATVDSGSLRSCGLGEEEPFARIRRRSLGPGLARVRRAG